MDEVETLKDIFIDDSLEYLKEAILGEIKNFMKTLFRIFDILYSVFITICFCIIAFGVFYYIN